MAERAHPKDPDFHEGWRFRLRRGFIPWLTYTRNNRYRAAFFERYQWVSHYCQDKDVLDIPCGMGWGTSLITGARSLIGVDIAPDAIAEAQQRYGALATFMVGNMQQLNFAAADAFDVICCLEGIEHIPVEVGRCFIGECYRVLRAGGLLLLSSPYCRTRSHSGNPFHLHEYSPAEIHALVEPYFVVEEVISKDIDVMTVLYLRCQRKS